ncbi:MAG: GerMN domain-containing protein [Acidimicrobiia bacterium]|nr:GerMN domain-containing protein [Acidimicrobiia bacterium]
MLLVLVLVAACGVTEDSSPRAISEERLPEGLTPSSTNTTVSGEGAPRNLYFVTGQAATEDRRRLSPIAREVESPGSTREVLEALLQPPEETDLGTLIPPETELLDTDLTEDGTLTIDLSEQFDSVQSEGQALAYAQIVFTVTDRIAFSDVRRVRFEVEGEPRDAPTDEGEPKSVVTRRDYTSFEPRPPGG